MGTTKTLEKVTLINPLTQKLNFELGYENDKPIAISLFEQPSYNKKYTQKEDLKQISTLMEPFVSSSPLKEEFKQKWKKDVLNMN